MYTTNLYDEIYANEGAYNDRSVFKMNLVLTWAQENDMETLLDVGCGKGHYLEFLSDEGFTLTALEPSKHLCDGVLQHYDVSNDTLLSFKPKKKWDGAYCMDVLEHIDPDDLDENLEKLKTLAPKLILGIANHSDIQRGVEVHLIQEEPEWWRKKLEEHFANVRLTYEPFRYMVFEVGNG